MLENPTGNEPENNEPTLAERIANALAGLGQIAEDRGLDLDTLEAQGEVMMKRAKEAGLSAIHLPELIKRTGIMGFDKALDEMVLELALDKAVETAHENLLNETAERLTELEREQARLIHPSMSQRPENKEPELPLDIPKTIVEFLTLDETQAVLTALQMIYQMGSMIMMNADDDDEVSDAKAKLDIISNLLRRIRKQAKAEFGDDNDDQHSCDNPFCDGEH